MAQLILQLILVEEDERHVPTPSSSPQTDTVVIDLSADLEQRLDRLESLMAQVAEKLVALEGSSCKRASTDGASRPEQVKPDMDRVESSSSLPSKATRTQDKPTQTDDAAETTKASPEPSFASVLLAMLAWI
ncbi:hypothetical protein AAVH_34012, partial [Aphelenchoides avenae]